MKKQAFILTIISLVESVSALSSNLQGHVYRSSSKLHVSTSSRLKMRTRSSETNDNKKKRKHSVCPEPELDLDLDSREATFAMLGQLWASSSSAVVASVSNIAGGS